MTLVVVVETADQPCLCQLFFGDCPHHACFRDHPLIAIAAVGGQSGKVFAYAQLLQSPLTLRRHLPLFPDNDSEPRSLMCVDVGHGCFHGSDGKVVYPSARDLINSIHPVRKTNRLLPYRQRFQLAFELLYRIRVRSAFPFFCFAVLVESESEIFQLGRWRDFRLCHVDFQPEFPLNPVRYCPHDPLRACFASDRNYAVIRISCEVQPSCFQFLVQFVQHDVAK